MRKEGVDSSGGRSVVDALVACRGLLEITMYHGRRFLGNTHSQFLDRYHWEGQGQPGRNDGMY